METFPYERPSRKDALKRVHEDEILESLVSRGALLAKTWVPGRKNLVLPTPLCPKSELAFKQRGAPSFAETTNALVILATELPKRTACTVWKVENPRLEMAKIIEEFFWVDRTPEDGAPYLAWTDVFFDENVTIERGARIGVESLGYERDKHGSLVRFPQMGGVSIRDNVFIGSNTCVARATFEGTYTTIGCRTKIAQNCTIGHNCVIGNDCLISSNTMLSGGVTVGDRVRIGPGVTITDHVRIGDDAVITLGSTVTTNVPIKATFTGYFAREHREYLKEAAFLRRLEKRS